MVTLSAALLELNWKVRLTTPLAAIKLVLSTQNTGRQSPPNEKCPSPARSTGAGPGKPREQSRECEVASTFRLPYTV